MCVGVHFDLCQCQLNETSSFLLLVFLCLLLLFLLLLVGAVTVILLIIMLHLFGIGAFPYHRTLCRPSLIER